MEPRPVVDASKELIRFVSVRFSSFDIAFCRRDQRRSAVQKTTLTKEKPGSDRLTRVLTAGSQVPVSRVTDLVTW
jgi:hypothetical protein